jgi:hypothetical protein
MDLSKFCKLSFYFIVSLYTHSSIAGAPYLTDDPEPVTYQKWEVNYALSKTWRNDSESAAIPSIDINYGFAPNFQLHVQPRYSFEESNSKGRFGLDNTEIGIKYRFVDQEQNDSDFMLGVYPKLLLPTGNDRLSEASGKTQAFLPIWAQLNTEMWTYYGGAGYRINNYSLSRNSWFFGATAVYKVGENLKIGGELYRETTSVQGGKYSSGFNLGGIYNISNDYNLLFSAGRALNNINESNKLSVFLALQVTH